MRKARVLTAEGRSGFRPSDIARKGVPQGRHAHGLLARGRNVIENFLPGWTDVVMRVIRGNLGRRSGGTAVAPAGAQA